MSIIHHLPNSYGQHKGGSRSVRDSNHASIDLTLDILNGCEHQCPGCFVTRQNSFIDNDLDHILDLISIWESQEFEFNELFLGPTDIFSANNFDVIVKNPKFQKLCNYFTFTCNSTLLNDTNIISRKLNLLNDNCKNWNERKFEIFVILDQIKYTRNDPKYLEVLNRNLKLIEKNNIFFIINIYSEDMFDEINLEELNAKLKRDFNSKLRINPSYFRGTSAKHLNRYAQLHKKIIENEVNDKNISKIFLNMLDVYFGGFTFSNYAYTNHELYVSPVIYEAIPQVYDMFKVNKSENYNYTVESLNKVQKKLFEKQYEYSIGLECESCEFLSSCVSRNVLSYMEHRGIADCFLPKKLFRDASKVIKLDSRKSAIV